MTDSCDIRRAGYGGDYQDRVVDNILGLEYKEENLEEVIRAAADAALPGGWTAGQSLST